MSSTIRPIDAIDRFQDDLGQVIPQAIEAEEAVPIELVHYLLLAHEAYSTLKTAQNFERHTEALSTKEGSKEGRGASQSILKPHQYPRLIARSLVLLQENLDKILTRGSRALQNPTVEGRGDKATNMVRLDTKMNETAKELKRSIEQFEEFLSQATSKYTSESLKPLFFQLHQLILLSDFLKKEPQEKLQNNPALTLATEKLSKFLHNLLNTSKPLSPAQLKELFSDIYKELKEHQPITKMSPTTQNQNKPAISSSSFKGVSDQAKPSNLTMIEQPILKTALMNLLGKPSVPLAEARQIQTLISRLPLAFVVPHNQLSPIEVRRRSKKPVFTTPEDAWKKEEEDLCEDDKD